MKTIRHFSKSVENINNSFINSSNTKRNDNIKTSRITRKKNLISNNNSSFIIIQDRNKYLIEKNYTQQMPASNFLEDMYIKYSKNLQKYFLKNQTGLKLAGNKYFQNLTVEEYMKQHKLTKEQFIKLLNGGVPLDNKLFANNKNLDKIKNEQFFLTPLPNKSRQLLNTNKEKSDFLEAERAAVVMRTFEYTHGIKSKVGIYEYKKIMTEQKQNLINLMLNAAKKIQRWWKKKYYYINKSRSDEKFNKKLKMYNDMLNKKKAKIFFDKFNNYVKRLLKPKRKSFLKKLKNKAKNSMRKFFTIYDWYNNMKICSEIELQINLNNLSYIKRHNEIINKNYGFINNFFMTKKLIFSKNMDRDCSNTENYQIKKIIFIQKVFKQFLKLKKEKETYRNGNKTQFSYINPNKILFLFNKSANSEAKESKSFLKTNRNDYSSRNYFEILNKNNKNQNSKILIEEDETLRGNLPSISPISKNKSKHDDIENVKINHEILNKKGIVSNIEKKLDEEIPNKNINYNKINLNNNNKSIKDLNSKFIRNKKNSDVISEIMRNNNFNIYKKIKNKSLNDNNNNSISKENNNINNENKNIFKKIPQNKNNKKANHSYNIYSNRSEKNSISSCNSNKMDSKNNKNNSFPYNNKTNDRKNKIINHNNNNEFNLNSLSNINRQISFGVDNTPSEIIKKNNINSFFDNENINNNSSSYYNQNNKDDSNNKKTLFNFKKLKTFKNKYFPQKKSFLNNILGLEENELSLINRKNKDENKNSLLIDSLEIENNKKIDKNIIKVLNSNENFEKSLPPEINLDNYQQDSTLDYRDKRIKSNQKTISTSAILRLDTSNNKNHESIYNFQMVGQICLNYIHRPNVFGDSYISKIRKNYFPLKINKSLKNLLNIKNSFSFSKLLFNNNINKSVIIKNYFNHWKNITRKESEPYTYSKTITSICTVDNNDKGEFFSYYSKINKSNQENDYVFLRITLGYKLLRKLFCGNDLKIFFYLLKKRRRKKNRAKTYIYNNHSKNIYNLLDFKIKLPILLNKIIIKKYCGIFYHKFLYFSLNLNNNIEYDLDNNKVCSLIREGYRKGYFGILYNVLRERFSFEYYSTGMKFESFIKNIFSLQ